MARKSKRPPKTALCFRAGQESDELWSHLMDARMQLSKGAALSRGALKLAVNDARFLKLLTPRTAKEAQKFIDQAGRLDKELEKYGSEKVPESEHAHFEKKMEFLDVQANMVRALSRRECGGGLPVAIPDVEKLLKER